MSSEKGLSHNCTPIQMCHDLLEDRNFKGVHLLVDKLHYQFEQARAISDVLLAAENLLPNGLMDYYGMIRVTRSGPVLLKDFLKLMKLLNGRDNVFPLSQEAADKALLAWSLLSKPHIKAQYDLAISTDHNREPQGNDRGNSSLGGSKSDGVFDGPDCSKFHESEDEVVIISDDEDEDEDDDDDGDDSQ